MVSSLINQIQIHSTLMSNIWDNYGSKTNIIDSVPNLDRSIGDKTITYEPTYTGSRICNVRDSVNSLQSINIYFTDEY